ncbi:hypothetical protein KIN20_015055 [Parelaphostrongylus tenuis]|uniref:Uncharacterized protein n=1 Tax=Parelaphostrongylus tenuis TaxID=148309 RepID=A0AAD5MWS0_PARTN|nr:hypothetical protein KIN20_015055 [Parelaphostrongylus tenuis]
MSLLMRAISVAVNGVKTRQGVSGASTFMAQLENVAAEKVANVPKTGEQKEKKIERDRLSVVNEFQGDEKKYKLKQMLEDGGYDIVFLSDDGEKQVFYYADVKRSPCFANIFATTCLARDNVYCTYAHAIAVSTIGTNPQCFVLHRRSYKQFRAN